MLKDPQCPEEQKNHITELLANITACVLKSYMDDLYYSGEYRNPEKAAMFHAYEANLQRLIGIMTSLGCKSANDRTWLVRLLIDTLATAPNPLSIEYHPTENNTALKNSQWNKRTSDNAISHAAMPACIYDNRGDPKFIKKFPFLKIKFGELIGKIGEKFAAHKLKDKIKSLVKKIFKKPRFGGLFNKRVADSATSAHPEDKPQSNSSPSSPRSRSGSGSSTD